jgi:hypothetical protein
MPNRRITATSLIIGAAIRNEKVTPKGIPDSTNPRNRGIAEQEQKGVTIPSIEAMTFPVKRDFPSNAFRVLSGVKKLRMIPTTKMIRISKRRTLGTSKMKNRRASVRCFPCDNLMTSSINQLVTG